MKRRNPELLIPVTSASGASGKSWRLGGLEIRMPSLDRANRLWVFLCALLVPVGGSVLTVLVWGALLWNIAMRLRGTPFPTLSRDQKAIAIVCALFALVHMATTLAAGGLATAGELLPLLIFLAPALLMPSLNESRPALLFEQAVKGFAFGTVAAAVIAIIQATEPGMRSEGFLGNAGVFAVVTLVAGSVGALNMRSSHWPTRLLGTASLTAMFVCVILSQMRGIIVLLPLYAILLLWASLPVVRANMIGKVAMAGLAIAAIMALVFSDILLNRFGLIAADYRAIVDGQTFDTSLGHRVLMWQGALGAIAEHPIFGYGLADRMQAVLAHVPADTVAMLSRYTHAHNGFLTAQLDAGLPGVISLVAMISMPVIVLIRAPLQGRERRVATVFVASFVLAYLASGMTNIMFHHDLMDAFFLFMMILTPTVLSAVSTSPQDA